MINLVMNWYVWLLYLIPWFKDTVEISQGICSDEIWIVEVVERI